MPNIFFWILENLRRKSLKKNQRLNFFALPNCFSSRLINDFDNRVIRYFFRVLIFNFQEPIDFQLEKENDKFIIIQDEVGSKLRQKCRI